MSPALKVVEMQVQSPAGEIVPNFAIGAYGLKNKLFCFSITSLFINVILNAMPLEHITIQ